MANRVKKLEVDVEVKALFQSALKQVDVFKKRMDSLSLPKTATKDLEKDLADYQKLLQKAFNFQPNTSNLSAYRSLIEQLNTSYQSIVQNISGLESKTSEAFSDDSKIETYKNRITELKNEIEKLDKATKSYYGVTSDDSEAKQKEAIAKKKQEVEKTREDNTPGIGGAALEATRKKQEEMTATLKQSAKAKKELVDAEKKLASETEKNNKKQEEAAKKTEEVVEASKDLPDVYKEAAKSLEEYTDQLAKSQTQQTADNITNKIKSMTAIGVAINYAREQIQKMKDTYSELDKSLTQIAVVSGKTREEMWNSVDAFNQMARRLGTTTLSIVEASKLYYQQGRTQSEVTKLVEQTSILASISELEYADATEYLTAAINGFKLEADDAVNITDVWANLAAKAAVDTSELAVAISKVASISKSAGAGIETTSAFLTKMINFATYARVA